MNCASFSQLQLNSYDTDAAMDPTSKISVSNIFYSECSYGSFVNPPLQIVNCSAPFPDFFLKCKFLVKELVVSLNPSCMLNDDARDPSRASLFTSGNFLRRDAVPDGEGSIGQTGIHSGHYNTTNTEGKAALVPVLCFNRPFTIKK